MAIKTFTGLSTLIATNLADNTSGAITPTLHRAVENDILDSLRVYGAMYTVGGASPQSLNTTPTRLTSWTANGASSGTTPDHTNDYITINTNGDGVYEVAFTMTGSGVAGTTYIFALYKNASAVIGAACRVKPASTDVTHAGFTTLVAGVAASDTISVYGESDAGGGANWTVVDAQLVIRRIA